MGVDIIRLDAVAFTWKRLGTNCQNQPEAHLIAQALRAALGIAAPASILLAEAIVGPDDLVPYLGEHARQRREWSSLTTTSSWSRDGPCSPAATPPWPRPLWPGYPTASRDDVAHIRALPRRHGWAVSDRDAAAVGLDGAAHRRFLAEIPGGDFPLPFGRGTAF